MALTLISALVLEKAAKTRGPRHWLCNTNPQVTFFWWFVFTLRQTLGMKKWKLSWNRNKNHTCFGLHLNNPWGRFAQSRWFPKERSKEWNFRHKNVEEERSSDHHDSSFYPHSIVKWPNLAICGTISLLPLLNPLGGLCHHKGCGFPVRSMKNPACLAERARLCWNTTTPPPAKAAHLKPSLIYITGGTVSRVYTEWASLYLLGLSLTAHTWHSQK